MVKKEKGVILLDGIDSHQIVNLLAKKHERDCFIPECKNGETWGANQKITVDEALRVNTINGAYNSHEENIKGSITAGKLADYVVLAEDLHTIDPEKIKDIKIARTVTGGKTVYQG